MTPTIYFAFQLPVHLENLVDSFDKDCSAAFGEDNYRGSLIRFGQEIVSSAKYAPGDYYQYGALSPAAALWMTINMPAQGELVNDFNFLEERLAEAIHADPRQWRDFHGLA